MAIIAAAQEMVQLARSRGVLITVAESCTGGLLAGAITEVPGASDIFERGFVTYSNRAKTDMLGVLATTLDAHGAVSEPVAREMAIGALSDAKADFALSITGIAGPGGSGHKPEGRVCFGLAVKCEPATAETVEFGALGRANVRAAAVGHGLDILLKNLAQ